MTATSSELAWAFYQNLPMCFIPNVGQANPEVKFYAKRSGCTFYFAKDKVVINFVSKESREGNISRLELKFIGANPDAKIMEFAEGSGKVNYFIGNNPDKWYTNIPTFDVVAYQDLWPGIDLILRGEDGLLKYDCIVQAGARVSDIRLSYEGASSLTLDNAGNLLISHAQGVLTDTCPVGYQEIGGRRVSVNCSFLLEKQDNGEFVQSFRVGNEYDPNYPLVIDPGLAYSTYLGGGGFDGLLSHALALDSSGNVYIAGRTNSNGANPFPTTAGVYDTNFNGGAFDAFVTKLSADGSSLIYSTYLGGGGFDEAYSIAVDADGNAYIVGDTNSEDPTPFPTTAGAFSTSFNGLVDAFVTKLSPDGSSLIYSTYLGGGGSDRGFAIALDATGSAYVTGLTDSTDPSPFPTTIGAYDTSYNGGVFDAFVTKLSPDGSSLIYSTYLGGDNNDIGRGIAVDSTGNAYVTGETNSSGIVPFPTTAGAFSTSYNGGVSDVFVTKLNSTGTNLVYSTFLGGGGNDAGADIAADATGNAYVTGFTNSTIPTPFPTSAGAYDNSFNGGLADAFLSKLNPAGSGLVYSTYLGGGGNDNGISIVVDSDGSAFITGLTDSTGATPFPTTVGAFDTSFNGGTFDAFVTKLSPNGSNLLYSTYLGGGGTDEGYGIAIDSTGAIYVAGNTNSTGADPFPTTVGAYDTSFNGGGSDAFVTKLIIVQQPPVRGIRLFNY